jgi:hypothetical protein
MKLTTTTRQFALGLFGLSLYCLSMPLGADPWPVRTVPAKPSDLKTAPMGELHPIEYQRSFNDEEMHKIRWGTVPAQQEDKWFAFMDGEALYIFRSWTGQLVWKVDFAPSPENGVVRTAWQSEDMPQVGPSELNSFLTMLARGGFP